MKLEKLEIKLEIEGNTSADHLKILKIMEYVDDFLLIIKVMVIIWRLFVDITWLLHIQSKIVRACAGIDIGVQRFETFIEQSVVQPPFTSKHSWTSDRDGLSDE